MPAKNKPRYVEFKGQHPHFKAGQSYTFAEYSDWTLDNNVDGGVLRATIKGRLYGEAFCTPRHLVGKRQFSFGNEKSKLGFSREARERVKNTPRLESKNTKPSILPPKVTGIKSP